MRNRITLDVMETGCCCKCVYSQSDGDNTLELYMWSVGFNPYIGLIIEDGGEVIGATAECTFLENGDAYYSADPEIFTGNRIIRMTVYWDGDQSNEIIFNCINLKPDANFTVTRIAANTFQVASADELEISLATKESTGIVQIGDGVNVTEQGIISVPKATTESAGIIQVGNGLIVDEDGKVSTYNYGKADPIESYEYISQYCVKINDITWEATLDSNGLIEKISDGTSELIPIKTGDDINNTTLHNAVIWATVMARGIKGSAKPIGDDSLTKMCEYRYNNDSMVQNGSEVTWQNQAIGNTAELVMSDAVVADGGVYLGNNTSKGTLLYENTVQSYTIYLVVNANKGHRILETQGSGASSSAVCFWGDTGIYRTTACISGSEIKSDVSSTTKAVLAVVKQADGGFSFYANGVLAGTKESGGYNLKSGEVCFSYSRLYGKSTADFYFYDFALAESAHSEADIIANSEYLMAKYGVTV